MAYGGDFTKASAICNCRFDILQYSFIQRQLVFAVTPMIDGTGRNADFSDAPCEAKLFFFGAPITVDYDCCTTGGRRLQYDARDRKHTMPNNSSFYVHLALSITACAGDAWGTVQVLLSTY
jgi:hypothetical protein